MKIHVGTSGYGYKEWKGKFYPEKISPGEMLRFYGERLGAVEINNTFYRLPTMENLVSWADQVPDGFIFALKAPQIITHRKRLKNVAAEMEHLSGVLPVLGRKRGPVLFQFPGSFSVTLTVLTDFLDLIPGAMSCAFEFRDPSRHSSAILELLRERGCCLCTADSDENPVDKIIPTAPWGYLRLHRSDYTAADLAQWMDRILLQKWERVFVFFKHEEEAKGPIMAMNFQALVK
jgi:uncharacterized protein YecE (DUF72 family)